MATADGEAEFDALLAAARAGDREAVGALFDRFRPWLRAVAGQSMAAPVRAKASGSDLVQDAFLEVQRIFERFHGRTPGELRAWLQAVVANKAADLNRHYLGTEMRDAAREQPADAGSGDGPGGWLAAAGPEPGSAVVRGEDAERVVAALAQLPPHYQEVIRLRTWDGLAFAEVGRLTGRSEDAARMLWGRALELLGEHLGPPPAT